MANRINQSVMINGKKCWITAKSAQEFADKIANLLAEGSQQSNKHPFAEYAWNWFNTYSLPNIATVTATTYQRQIETRLIPGFAGLAVEDITPDHVQQLFNQMHVAKATKEKAKMVLNQILNAALEDKLITANPLCSRKVRITGAASKATEPYSVEQMRYLAQHLDDIQNSRDRAFLALHIYHPLRPEEVLGLMGGDVDFQDMTLTVRRAVTHPDRNQPEIKDTKTLSSHRIIGLSAKALPYITATPANEFILGGEKPLSYTVVRKMCERIRKDIRFADKITPSRFRTTVLTDLYDQTKDIKLTQLAAGHTTSAMTLKHYVKGRETMQSATAAIENIYSA